MRTPAPVVARRAGPARWLVLWACSVWLLGCRATLTVDIETHDDGAGEVVASVDLDAEALRIIGGEATVVTDDLEGTRWTIEESSLDGGGHRWVARRSFSDADDLRAALGELAGPGVFGDVTSEVDHSFARTDSEVSVQATVTGDPAQFSDEALTDTLGGLAVGYTPEELEFIGAAQPGSAEMTLRVRAPGAAPDEVTFDLTSREPQTARATSVGTDRDLRALAAGAVGVVLLFIGSVLTVVVLVSRRRTRCEPS